MQLWLYRALNWKTQKNKEVLDICLAGGSPEVKAKVYEILEISELDADDNVFSVGSDWTDAGAAESSSNRII